MDAGAPELIVAGEIRRRMRWENVSSAEKIDVLKQLEILEPEDRPWNAKNKKESWHSFASELAKLECFKDYVSLSGRALKSFVEALLSMSHEKAAATWTSSGGHPDEGGDEEQEENTFFDLWLSVAGKFVEDKEALEAEMAEKKAIDDALAAKHARRGALVDALGHGDRAEKRRAVSSIFTGLAFQAVSDPGSDIEGSPEGTPANPGKKRARGAAVVDSSGLEPERLVANFMRMN